MTNTNNMIIRDSQLTQVVIFAWHKGWRTCETIEADIKAGVKQKNIQHG